MTKAQLQIVFENFEETTKRWAKAKKYSRKRDEKICGNEQEN